MSLGHCRYGSSLLADSCYPGFLICQGAPTPEDLGFAESIVVEEVSSKQVTIIQARDSKVATIVLRGATPNILDEVERTIGKIGLKFINSLNYSFFHSSNYSSLFSFLRIR